MRYRVIRVYKTWESNVVDMPEGACRDDIIEAACERGEWKTCDSDLLDFEVETE